jgi:S1-C subfamily serine protease
VDDERFNEGKDLSEIISEYKSGDKINVKVVRDGKEMGIDVVLGGM